MSRSNPHDSAPNPAVRWFEWNGEAGTVRYYDRDAKQNVDVGSDFRFMLLDELGSVRGWHEATSSGIYSNEVRDTRKEPLIVKSFKGGTLVEGTYREIKDRVATLGGQFVANCYIAFKNDADDLVIGSLRFKGAALGAWMEFRKANRSALYKKAVAINGYTEGKKGRVVFRVPVLKLVDITKESNDQASGLDAELQVWLKGYFKRNTSEQVENSTQDPGAFTDADAPHLTDEDVPF
jgi:hypothetical protein